MKTAFITGCNGFVGDRLFSRLKDQGIVVTGFDLKKSNLNYSKTQENRICGDILDINSTFEILKKYKPQKLYHLAAYASAYNAKANLELIANVNVKGTENIVRAIVSESPETELIYISSGTVYGSQTIITEETTVEPKEPYAKSKLRAEEIVNNYIYNDGLRAKIVRPFNHIGAEQSLGFVCSDYAKRIVDIEKGIVSNHLFVSGSNNVRNYSDVADVVAAYCLIAEKGKVGDIYNISSDNYLSVEEIVRRLIVFSKLDIKIEMDNLPALREELYIDNSKIKKLGWEYKKDFKNIFKEIVEYWREN